MAEYDLAIRGGTITTEDAEFMRKRGVYRIFFAGTSLE